MCVMHSYLLYTLDSTWSSRPIILQHSIQRSLENALQRIRFLESNTKPTKIRRTPEASRPFELVEVGEQNERRSQREVRA